VRTFRQVRTTWGKCEEIEKANIKLKKCKVKCKALFNCLKNGNCPTDKGMARLSGISLAGEQEAN